MHEQMALSGVKAGHNDVLMRGADVARAIKKSHRSSRGKLWLH